MRRKQEAAGEAGERGKEQVEGACAVGLGLGRAAAASPGLHRQTAQEAGAEGVIRVLPPFPRPVPNCHAPHLPRPSPPHACPQPGKIESKLIKRADCLETKSEGWRQFGGLIFPSCAIIWW